MIIKMISMISIMLPIQRMVLELILADTGTLSSLLLVKEAHTIF